MTHSILDLDIGQLKAYLESKGFAGFSSKQIYSWIYKKGVYDFQKMSNLSGELRGFLKRNNCILSLVLIEKHRSFDGAQKFLFGLCDKNAIESVLIPAAKRLTVCISTQAGCKFACRFCASGAKGFMRSLSCAEIIEQIILLQDNAQRRINNIVFMGVGEPLDNYDNVIKSIRILNSFYSFHIGARKITISTCGLISGIRRLAEENLQIELSVSLHAADNKTRDFLMPVNKRFPLEKLIPACRSYFKKTKRQVTFEYVLIRGINSDVKQAQMLARRLRGFDAKVNLISVNPFKTELPVCSSSQICYFQDALAKAGIPVTLRRPRGSDIKAACGQLRLTKIR